MSIAHELIQVAEFKKIAAVRTEKLLCNLLEKALATQDSTYLQHPLGEKGLCDRTGVIQELKIQVSETQDCCYPVLYLRGI